MYYASFKERADKSAVSAINRLLRSVGGSPIWNTAFYAKGIVDTFAARKCLSNYHLKTIPRYCFYS